MKAINTNRNGMPTWTPLRRPTNVGCTPMHPVDFHRMTPKQRKALAARRSREVQAAQEAHDAQYGPDPFLTMTTADIQAITDAIRDATAHRPRLEPAECLTTGCNRTQRLRRGKCEKHYRQELRAERHAA